MDHNYQDLITIFNDCFYTSYNTQLVKGEDEPLYLPANKDIPFHAIYFAHGYFSSALHECAHWLIAGEARRKEIDYGYWYIPDGRNAKEQALFQQVEVKPQALEWILSLAANYHFHFSLDNLHGETSELTSFKEAVYQQVLSYCREGLSERALCFREALALFYGTPPLAEIQKILEKNPFNF